VDILTLLAIAQGPDGTEAGLALAREATDLAAPGGILRPFVEAGEPMAELLRLVLEEDPDARFAAEALAAIDTSLVDTGPRAGRNRSAHPPRGGGSPARGGGPRKQEIAARIYRSIETVKKHLYNTYQKLEVDGRIAALSRARELGILPPEGS
jgi:LuxR family maltose regulon positive regulatory protein